MCKKREKVLKGVSVKGCKKCEKLEKFVESCEKFQKGVKRG